MKLPKKKDREEYEVCIHMVNLFREKSSYIMLNDIIKLATDMKNARLASGLIRKLNLHLREIVTNMAR